MRTARTTRRKTAKQTKTPKITQPVLKAWWGSLNNTKRTSIMTKLKTW